MPTETLPTRRTAPAADKLAGGLVSAIALHAVVLLVLAVAAWISHRANPHWGDANPTAGAIQASMVSALPLPPRRYKDNEVLASENPSPAPTPPSPAPPAPKPAPTPKAEAPPKPNEVLIPTKVTPPKPATRAAEKPAPTPAKPAATKAPPTTAPPSATRVPVAPTTKATTGETAGTQIPQSTVEMKNGTATVSVDERSFGDRYAYYIKQIVQKINQSKQRDQDPPETKGKRTVIRFTITREGLPIDADVATRSGSPALDSSTLRAIQRIDTFGDLPAGDHITISFGYTSH